MGGTAQKKVDQMPNLPPKTKLPQPYPETETRQKFKFRLSISLNLNCCSRGFNFTSDYYENLQTHFQILWQD